MIDAQYFPNFVRGAIPKAGHLSSEDIMELHGPFCEYLEGLTPWPLAMDVMVDISPKTVVDRQLRHWGHINGYHPALIWHFTSFTDKMKKEAERL